MKNQLVRAGAHGPIRFCPFLTWPRSYRTLGAADSVYPVNEHSMTDEQGMVAEFHRTFGIAEAQAPTVPDESTRTLRSG